MLSEAVLNASLGSVTVVSTVGAGSYTELTVNGEVLGSSNRTADLSGENGVRLSTIRSNQ